MACHVLEILQGEGDFRIRDRLVAANQPMGKHWTYFPMAVWQENIVAPASTLIISNASEVLSHQKNTCTENTQKILKQILNARTFSHATSMNLNKIEHRDVEAANDDLISSTARGTGV